MLDIKFVLDNIDLVTERLSHRSGKFPLEEITPLANSRRSLIVRVETLKAEKNTASKLIADMRRSGINADTAIADMKKLGDDISALDGQLATVEHALQELMYALPNIPDNSVPIGADSENNLEVRKFGLPTAFSFVPKSHWELGENRFFDWARASKITGARFTVCRGWGAKLERAIMNFMLDTHSESGYTEIFPPFMVNRDSMVGTGQLPKFEEDMFAIKDTNYYLVPTAEVPVTNLHRNEVLSIEELPIKYCAYTACFRAEAGSAGRDTRGLIRQHQFNKVELVKFVQPKDSYAELECLTNNAEQILQALGLPYRVVALCSGDLGFCSAKTYDIEVWMPSYDRYVEISSCSNFEDFQARRANIKYRDENKKTQLVHTLNGSGLAIGRTTAAIVENYQNEDGSISIPKCLQKYMGVDRIS